MGRYTMNAVPKEIMEMLHELIKERDELKKELDELKQRLMQILKDEQDGLL